MRMWAASATGLAKHRVQLITGIGRSTIDRILGATASRKGQHWGIRRR